MSRLEAVLNLEVTEELRSSRIVRNKSGLVLSGKTVEELKREVCIVVDQTFDKFVQEKSL